MPSGYWPLAAPYLTFAFHSHGQVQQTTDTRGMDIMACDKIRGSTERFLVQGHPRLRQLQHGILLSHLTRRTLQPVAGS